MAENRNLPATTNTIKTLQTLLKAQEKQFAMVLPKTLGIDRFIRITISTVIQNPKLLQCDQRTFLRSLLTLASLGLEPGGPLGLAHLVPFWNSRENRFDCQPIIDYKGYIALAHNSKEVGRITAHIVYDKEKWKFSEGDVIIHEPLPPSTRGEKKVLVYAKAFDRSGVLIAQEMLWAEEVEAIKAKSLGNKKNVAANPWNTAEEAMWRKSPVRRMAKWMPMAAELQMAARIEEAQEEGFDLPDLDLGDAGGVPPPTGVDQKTDAKTQALKDKLQATQIPTKAGDQVGAPSNPVTEGANMDRTPTDASPSDSLLPGEVVDAEFEEPPPPGEPTDQPPATDPPQQGDPSQPAATSGAPLPSPYNAPPEEPKRSSVVMPTKGSKAKESALFGPKDGPKMESGKKVTDYWLDNNMVKCPPGGTREGLITNAKGFCNTECKYRKRCFLFKD